MNRSYRLIWNRALRTVQVASELAASTGGGNAAGVASAPRRRHQRLTVACAAALALVVFALPAWSATCTVNGVVRTDDACAFQTAGVPQLAATALMASHSTMVGIDASSGGIGGAGGGAAAGNGGSGNGSGGSGGDGAVGMAQSGGNGGAGGAGTGPGVGGVGGAVGATSIGSSSITGGNGGAGAVDTDTILGSGGGGGGGAGVYTSGISLDLAAGLSITGGNGGNAGVPNRIGGGGGGGGAGLMSMGASATLQNDGTITGGNGGSGAGYQWGGGGGGGGDGVFMANADLLANYGTIVGGAGGATNGGFGSTAGVGGAGVDLGGGNPRVWNYGTITGGSAPMQGGAGIFAGTGIGVANEANATLVGGSALGNNSHGGAGIYAHESGSTPVDILNGTAILSGGAGGTASAAFGYGGAGIDTSGSRIQITNDGTIEGGQGGGVGGGGGLGGTGIKIAVSNAGVGAITNTSGAVIQGGIGGATASGDLAGTGISASGTVGITNDAGAAILGDSAGVNAVSYRGGTGIIASDGVVIDNSGTIAGTGGSGIAGSAINANHTEINNYAGGVIQAGNGIGTGTVNGAAAIVATGYTAVVNAGSILGGSTAGTGSAGNAVTFSGGHNSLDLEVGSTITGNIVSTSGTTTGDIFTLDDNPSGGGSDSINIGTVSGFAQYQKSGSSTWTLTGTGTSDQDWLVGDGTLAGDATSIVGNITFNPAAGDTAAVTFDQGSGNANSPTTATYAGAITGDGGLTKTDDGTLILTGANTFSGGTTISSGTLQVGSGGSTGSIGTGDVADNATLVFDRSDTGLVFAGAIAGNGTIKQQGTGTLTLNGDSSAFTGTTNVNAGTLIVGDTAGDGAVLGGSMNVAAGATLGGNGVVGGSVGYTAAVSGTLTPGSAGTVGTLGFGNLLLNGGAVLDFDLGAPAASNPMTTAGTGDHIDVAGQLSFENPVTLNLSDAGGMGPGLYNLASYGTLVMNNCAIGGSGTQCMGIGTVPAGSQAYDFTVVNNTSGQQIDLYNTAGMTLNIWDPSGNPSQLGGTGTWTVTSPTWTDPNGDGPFAMNPQPGFAIFQGTPGTVTVSDANGQVSATGLQFAVDGYTLSGDSLTLVGSGGSAPIIEVGDGSSASAGMTATIDNELQATDGFTKTGAGTLIFGSSQYTGAGVAVQGGTLQLGDAPNSGAGLYTSVAMAPGTHLVLDDGGVVNGYGAAAAVSGQDFSITVAAAGASDLNGIWGGRLGRPAVGNTAAAAIAGTGFTATFSGNTTIAGASSPTAGGSGAAAITGSGFYVSNSAAGTANGPIAPGVRGGAGGYSAAGTGGVGGAGITGAGFTVVNTGGVYGGAGGGTSTGTAGLGGAGIFSTGGATVTNEGTISGGMSGDGTTQADAIDFTGGGNTLELVAHHPGTFNGAIVVTRAAGDPADTLELGGDTGSDTFDLSKLASGGEFGGFNAEAKSGGSTWTLTGTGSSSENWTITGGTLVGDATALQGDVTFAPAAGDTATVAFNQASNGTFAGAISGSGDLTKSGTGTLILTGANTFTGSTTISAGTLQVGNGGTSGALGTGAITDNGTLVFDRSDAVALPAGLTGSGALIQQGSGTFTVNGDDSGFAGTTTIKAGTATVGDDSHPDATLGGTVNIAKGATLTGIGTIGGLDLSGTLSPGGSIGTFHVNGDATFEKGSTFNVEANADGSADKLAVTGKTTIKGGNTVVLSQPGNWAPSTTYTLITSGGGVTGTFADVSDNQAFLTPTLIYKTNAVDLSLARNQTSFPDVAATPNQKGAAAGIEGIGSGNALYDAVVKLTAADARIAFDQTSGEYYAGQQTARIDDSRYIREAMDQRLRQGDADPEATLIKGTRLTAWAHGWGHWGTVDSDGNAAKLADNGDGLLVGADLPVGTGRVGFTGGASRNSLSVDDRNSWGKQTSTWLGAFGGVNAGAFGFRAGLAYAWDQVSGNREVNFPGYSDRLTGDASGNTFTGFIEGAWTFKFGQGDISPFLNLANTRVTTHTFTETGGVAALHGEASTTTVTFSTLGARGKIDFAHHLDLHGELGWQHAFRDNVPEQNLQFVAGGPVFTEYGVPIAQNAGIGRVGLGWHHGAVAVDADYEGLAGGGTKDQAAKLSVSVAF